jgi:hypothetical protein
MKKFIFPFLIIFFITLWPLKAQARVTPEDIINAQKEEYNLKVKNYSPQYKTKLETYSKKIDSLNKAITADWEAQMVKQGEILDEYVRRKSLAENGGKDGINRNLTEPVENARYWLTYAHEAVAYQAAKNYIFDLTGEKNVNSDILSEINLMQSDLNILRNKVIKSQNIISDLIGKN